MSTPTHALRAALNGALLQLEVARLALTRDDRDLLERAIEASHGAAQRAAGLLQGRRLVDEASP